MQQRGDNKEQADALNKVALGRVDKNVDSKLL